MNSLAPTFPPASAFPENLSGAGHLAGDGAGVVDIVVRPGGGAGGGFGFGGPVGRCVLGCIGCAGVTGCGFGVGGVGFWGAVGVCPCSCVVDPVEGPGCEVVAYCCGGIRSLWMLLVIRF